MKKFALLIILFLPSFMAYSQDEIIRKNGDRISCTITKIDSANVYFSLTRNNNTLNTSISKSEIQDIRYNVINTPNVSQTIYAAQLSQYYKDSLPQFSVGLGGGINNYTALIGISGNVRVYNKIGLQGGLGLGLWGTKLSFGVMYNKHNNGGWSYGIGYSICSGINNIKDSLEVSTTTSIGTTTTTTKELKMVKLNFLTASTINLKASYAWVIKRRNTIYFDFGWAIPLETDPWKVTDGSVLTNNGNAVLRIFQPGGLILGAGFTLGL